jgi:hypothetical protein
MLNYNPWDCTLEVCSVSLYTHIAFMGDHEPYLRNITLSNIETFFQATRSSITVKTTEVNTQMSCVHVMLSHTGTKQNQNLPRIHWAWWFGSVLASSAEGWRCVSGYVKVCGSAVNRVRRRTRIKNN